MRSHKKALCLLMSVCFIAVTATIALAQDGSPSGKCSFQTINIPAPANLGSAAALNDSGAIAGTFEDSNFHTRGFLLFQGKLTTFMFPGSTTTDVHDMNATGTIVGEFKVGVAPQRAFMVHAGGFHEITIPGHPNVPAVALGVNDNGAVVGQFNSNNTPFGFLLQNGKLTILSFPGAQAGTTPVSINNQGVIVGTYLLFPDDIPHGFMWKAGVFSNLNPPDSGGSSEPMKISNAGDIVGSYVSTADSLEHGFSFDNGKFTTIDAPSSEGTAIVGVNKFDNVIIEAAHARNNVVLKGFCSAVF
jgi:uncharacterized membrane protein